MAGDVEVKVTITKINDHTRVDAGDVEHTGDVAVQINSCDLPTIGTHPMEMIGWKISSMNHGFMPSVQNNKITGYMN